MSQSPPAASPRATSQTPIATATIGQLTIKKWRLPNGLEIITVPDARASSVSYVTTFRVGSRNENADARETGLAHLFEHLMFTQTRGAAAGAFDATIEALGGSSNAATDYDFTSYLDEVPPEGLARVVALEADRMTNLDLLDRQVESERDVVVEERLSVVEDSVDGTLDERLYGQAFQKHPYRWPVIGRMEDIKAFTKDTIIAFYRRHYAPNRAVISVAGNFDEQQVLALIEAAYGALAAAPDSSAAPTPPESAPHSEVSSSLEKPVPADRFVVGYPAPALAAPERVAYEVMAEILAGGPSSRLNRPLVVEKVLASSVQGQLPTTRDPALFGIWIQMRKGHVVAEADAILSKETSRLATELVPDDELAAAKNRLETEFWRGLGSSRGRAETLGQVDAIAGDFRLLAARATAYADITAANVLDVAKRYLGQKNRSVVIARPSSNPR